MNNHKISRLFISSFVTAFLFGCEPDKDTADNETTGIHPEISVQPSSKDVSTNENLPANLDVKPIESSVENTSSEQEQSPPEETITKQALTPAPDINTIVETLNSIAIGEYKLLADDNFVSIPESTLAAASLLAIASGENISSAVSTDDPFSVNAGFAAWRSNPALIETNYGFEYSNLSFGQTGYFFSNNYLDSIASLNTSPLTRLDFIQDTDSSKATLSSTLATRPALDIGMLNELENNINNKTRFVFLSTASQDVNLDITEDKVKTVEGLWQDNGEQERVPMLQWQGTFPRFDQDGFKSVRLPMQSGKFQLTVIMPQKDTFDSAESEIRKIISDFDSSAVETKMEFVLPTFDISTTSPVGNLLEEKVDFNSVNDQGYLFQRSVAGRSAVSFDARSFKSKAATTVILEGVQNELLGLFEPSYVASLPERYRGSIIGSVFVSSQGNFQTYSECYLVPEQEGPTQARPFIFVIQEVESGAITQIGRVKALDGIASDRQVCESERIIYPDNIWPILGENISGDGHINTNAYIAAVDIAPGPTENLISSAIHLYNATAYSAFDNLITDDFLVSPYTQLQIDFMSTTGSPDDVQLSFLQRIGAETIQAPLKDALSTVNPLNNIGENRSWVQSNYEVKNDYLDFLSAANNAPPVLSDFLQLPAESASTISHWISDSSQIEIAPQFNLGMRTRFAFGSAFSVTIAHDATPATGSFQNSDGTYQNVALIHFNGLYPAYNNDVLDAFEIRSTDSNVDVLFIIPKPDFFGSIASNLSQTITEIDNGLTEKMVSIKLPTFTATQDDLKSSHTNSVYSNASEIRPLLGGKTSTQADFRLEQSEIFASAHGVSTLEIPGSYSSVNVWSYPMAEILPIPGPTALCISQADFPSTDALPFIYVVRDRQHKIVLQTGKFTKIDGATGLSPAICEVQPLSSGM